MSTWEKIWIAANIIFYGLGILVVVGLIVSLIVAHWDFFPASGEAYGYIYYQEVNGWYWSQQIVCWKDTPYVEDCEIFDPDGKYYQPGKYHISYDCKRFVWAWEAPSECKITGAEMLTEGV